jgi:hypothetical protein
MFCTRCGTKNPKDSANCFNCGQNLAISSDFSPLTNDTQSNSYPNQDVARAIKEHSSKLNDAEYRQAALSTPMHLFFFTAVDRNGVIRFFDIMEWNTEFSVAETATTAPRLAACAETVYEVPRTAEVHHLHRNYGSYSKANTPSALVAITQFAKVCGLTQVAKTAEVLTQLQALPTWQSIFQRLGCSSQSYSLKSVASFSA